MFAKLLRTQRCSYALPVESQRQAHQRDSISKGLKPIFSIIPLILLCHSVAFASIISLEPVEDRGIEYIYPEPNNYDNCVVTVDYPALNDHFRARIQATGLKPAFTYQVKLIGIPACQGGDDETNERIGYAGRWTCVDCDGSPAGNNRTDAQYEANKAVPDDDPNKECIAGYLVFDYFTTDESGSVGVDVEADASYHVLWCGPAPGSNAYLYSGYTPPGSYCEEGKYCDYDHVSPENERSSFNGLPAGSYSSVKIALTEESFHQNCGTWCTVLDGFLAFEIDSDCDKDDDGYLAEPCGGLDCDDDPSDDPVPPCDTCSCGVRECADCARCLHPGAIDFPADGVDSDCDGIEPPWGTPALSLGSKHEMTSDIVNLLAFLVPPTAFVLLWKGKLQE